MKRFRIMAAVAGVCIASGTTALAYAGDGKQQVAIYTPRLSGDHFVCSAVNVSDKTLGIEFVFVVLDDQGKPLTSNANSSAQSAVSPGAEAEIDLRFNSGIPPTDGYCKVVASGTHESSDVRVDLQVYWTKPITPGTQTPIIQLARTVQGY
ncbi:MAG TPA: hypothetical protein VJ770_05395 [Stellaceae bacterium]|nr:hypothetical protein [Stellaceae bacterium]